MMPLIRYMIANYTRSYRYFAPVAFMLISVVFIYAYRPNPIMDSYAVTAALLFIGSAWLGMNFLNHDQGRQAVLLIVQSGSAGRYYIGQYLAIILIVMMFSLFAVGYPIAANMFDKPITMSELVIGYSAHAVLSMLGASLSMYFQSGWMENQGRAAGLLLLVMIVSLAGQSVGNQLPEAASLVRYLLPPVWLVMDMMVNAPVRGQAVQILAILYAWLYSLVLLAVYVWCALRRDAAVPAQKGG
ncbi:MULTISPECIES: hypothetical protein [Paenibacillus]|nr:hypothetical protein [Paenibacillus campinasensis]